MVGEGAVLVDGVGDGDIDAARFQLARVLGPDVEILAAVAGRGWSYLVATDATGVLGYAYFTQLRDRSAYRFTAENSIYVREDVRGQGVGKLLVARLLADAETAGFRQMIAVIGDSENIGSIGVHTSLGFKQVGLLRASGLKFGRWVDTVYMQRALGRGDVDVPG